jgi:tetratricopeptide (TPR) repeat protein
MGTILCRNRNRAWLVCAAVVVALIGGAVWIVQDRMRDSSAERGESASDAATYALAVNGDEISYEVLAVAARRAETYYLEGRGLSPSFLQGANGAYVRLSLLRDAVLNVTQQTLIVQEARARRIEVSETRVEEEAQRAFGQLVSQSGGSGEDLAKALAEVGQTLDEFKANFRDEARVRLLAEAVDLAVLGQITASDADLRAFFESRKGEYAASFDAVIDRVRSDYNRAEIARRREEWLSAQVAQAKVTLALPILAAFYEIAAGKDEGLVNLERLGEAKTVFDPYLPYYIGRIRYDHAIAAFGERRDLESKLGATPSSDQLAQIETLRKQEEDSTARALAAYVTALNNGVEGDEPLLTRILQLGPPPALRSFVLGLVSLARGDLAGAEARLLKAIEQDDRLALAHVTLGDLAAQKGDPAKARALYKEEEALSPNDVDILLRVGDSFLSLGEFDEAQRLFEAARALAPGYARLRIAEGDLALSRLHGAVRERDLLQAQATRTPSEDAQLAALGNGIADLYGAARRLYEEALAQGAGEDVLVKLGNAQWLVGEYESASSTFRTVLRRSARYPEAHVGLGDTLVALGDEVNAMAHYEAALTHSLDAKQQEGVLLRVLQIEPDNRSARLSYGAALVRQGRWQDAIRELSWVLESEPGLVEAHLWIAESFSALGDYASAFSHLKAGLDGATTASERESACAQIVSTVRGETQSGETPSSVALDALINVAETRLANGDPEGAADALAWLAELDPAYRQADVRGLLEEAGKAPSGPATAG